MTLDFICYDGMYEQLQAIKIGRPWPMVPVSV